MYSLLEFKIHGDERGSLVSLEEFREIPFSVKRVYYIFDTVHGTTRGCHAHKNLEQVLICVKGSCTVLLDDGKSEMKIKLDKPNQGLLINGLIWREMYDFSSDCVLVVLASKYYDENDYIRDKAIFNNLHGRRI